mgnify:FL=1|tara:strand:- start:44 stop:547 length:504 start_codon:yes stop_codon:yes gene_type:complete
MSGKISHCIKKRDKANDVFITPLILAKKQIDLIEFEDDDIWYDPFKNTGNYYEQFPNDNKCWSEILYGEDFFEQKAEVDIICSNPPYSMIDKVLEKSISLNPRVISYLIGMGNLTARRIEIMNNAGYGLSKIVFLKVQKWYGMSFIVHFERDCDNCIDIDRTVYYSV